MWRYTLRSVLAHKARLVLTAVAILLGVGVVAGTFVLTDTAKAAAEAAFTDAGRGVSVIVVGTDPRTTTSDELAYRIQTGVLPPVPGTLVDRIARVEGVASATGAVFGSAQLVGRNGRLIGGGRAVVGRSLDESFVGRLSDGRLPAGSSEVVLDRATAREQRFGVGDQVRVIATRPDRSASLAKGAALQRAQAPQTLRVVGILDSPEYPDWVLVGLHPATASELLAAPDVVSAVEVRAAPGLAPGLLRDRVAAAVGSGFSVITGSELADARALRAQPDDVSGQIAAIAAVVALFVGAFVIRNTFTIILAGRARELALLRCVGAGRAQVRRSALLESAVVGAVASLGGLVFGVVVAWGLAALFHGSGELRVDVTGTVPRILPRTVVVALAVGIVTAIVSAWGPARHASRMAPVAALRGEVFAVGRRESRVRAAVGAVLTVAGGVAMAVGASGTPVRTGYLQAGAAATAIGLLVLGPVLAKALSQLIGAPIVRIRGAAGALAHRNAARSPRRTSATVLPLVIGLALITMITVLAAATKSWAVRDVDRTFQADFRLQSVTNSQDSGFAPLDGGVADRLTGLAEFTAVASFQAGGVTVAGSGGQAATAVDPAHLAPVLNLPVTAGAWSDVGDGSIAVSADAARSAGLAVGSPVTVGGPRGERTVTVRAIYQRPEPGYLAATQVSVPVGNYVIDPADYRRLAADDDTDVSAIYLATRPGVSSQAALAALEQALVDHPAYATIEIMSFDEIRRLVADRINPALRIYYSLLGLMVVIALFGIVNTLVLHVVARTREIGLIRAVGMQRWQVRTMIRWEAVIVSGTGTVLGLTVGSFLGWALTRAMRLPVVIPEGQLAMYAAAAVVVGVAAAVVPARRAARIDILRAITTE